MTTSTHPGGPAPNHVIVALTGFMGSGKTATGAALAELLGWTFIDLDHEIECAENLPIRQLFRERGEPAFRGIEHEALRSSLARVSSSTILALGGGAFVQSNNVELLRSWGALTVFLETPVEEMVARCGVAEVPDEQNPRPLVADATAFRQLYEQRLPFYRTADLTVDTSGKTVEAVVKKIAERLGLTAIR